MLVIELSNIFKAISTKISLSIKEAEPKKKKV